MIIAVLIVLGLCFGSFVNALVWRLHEQAKRAKKSSKKDPLSITTGRSMCPHCKHELAAKDLIPVLSWLSLGGKCRYCHKPIPDSPLVELLLPLLFVASYHWWPVAFSNSQKAIFVLWLIILVGLVALLIYDLRWMLLPDRLVLPLTVVAFVLACVAAASSPHHLRAVINTVLAVLVGGGLFYVLFQLSSGKWIGGGDVKLGWLFGLIVGTPGRSFLVIFLAAALGSLVSLPLLSLKRLKATSQIPFGPFLIVATVIVVLFGSGLTAWYRRTFLSF